MPTFTHINIIYTYTHNAALEVYMGGPQATAGLAIPSMSRAWYSSIPAFYSCSFLFPQIILTFDEHE